MTDQDLGKSHIVETDKGDSYMVLDNVAIPSLGKLYLESQPIASREGLVGTGMTCYRARMPDSKRWSHILRLKWRWARERPEDELLKLAKEKCLWGPRVPSHLIITKKSKTRQICAEVSDGEDTESSPGFTFARKIGISKGNSKKVVAVLTDLSNIQKKPTTSFKIVSLPASSPLLSADLFIVFSLSWNYS